MLQKDTMNMLFERSARLPPWMRRLTVAGFAVAALCVVAAPASAERDGRGYREYRDEYRRDRGYEDRREWRHEGRRDWDDRYRYRGPPPPVYYQPRPVYVPPPVYYGPPRGPSFNLFLP